MGVFSLQRNDHEENLKTSLESKNKLTSIIASYSNYLTKNTILQPVVILQDY